MLINIKAYLFKDFFYIQVKNSFNLAVDVREQKEKCHYCVQCYMRYERTCIDMKESKYEVN